MVNVDNASRKQQFWSLFEQYECNCCLRDENEVRLVVTWLFMFNGSEWLSRFKAEQEPRSSRTTKLEVHSQQSKDLPRV